MKASLFKQLIIWYNPDKQMTQYYQRLGRCPEGSIRMTDEKRALEILRETGALQEGHFLLTSGRHSRQYLQSSRIFQNPRLSGELCTMLADAFSALQVDLVVGPAMGAVQMAYEMSRLLQCENIFTERENGVMALRRGFFIRPGQKVLVVEDTVTTGGSVREVMELVRRAGGEVVGIGTIVDRSNGLTDFGVFFHAALAMKMESWEPHACPLCKEGAGAPQKPHVGKVR